MSVILVNFGAEVIGYSSCRKTETRLFDLFEIKEQITNIKGGDVRPVMDKQIQEFVNERK